MDALVGRVSEGMIPGLSDLGPSEKLVVGLAGEPACLMISLEALFTSVECGHDVAGSGASPRDEVSSLLALRVTLHLSTLSPFLDQHYLSFQIISLSTI